MTITAKYASKCPRCGGQIEAGDKVEWKRGEKARHAQCPDDPEPAKPREGYGKSWSANGRQAGESCGACGKTISHGDGVHYHYIDSGKRLEHTDCRAAERAIDKRREEQEAREAAAPYALAGGSGYGCEGWTVGQTLRSNERHRAEGWPEFVTVTEVRREYVREDGLCFGVGEDSGYLYYARARAATEEEAAPVREAIAERNAKRQAREELAELERRVVAEGECPQGEQVVLDGEVLLEQRGDLRLYGGGSWWVVAADKIWLVRNNGADGDRWDVNNIRTGGAGAIGHCVPRTADLQSRLARLAEVLG